MQQQTISVGTRGHRALVDPADFDRLSQFRWNYSNGYAMNPRFIWQGRKWSIAMHRYIMDLLPGDPREVDHINRDRLDNRRANLRVVDHSTNTMNQRARRDASSQFRAVLWAKDHSRWRAVPVVRGKSRHLGYFQSEVEAAVAVERWRQSEGPHGWERDELLDVTAELLASVTLPQ